MKHKNYVLPEIDLSHDQGDPRYLGRTTGHYAEYWRLCIVDDWAECVAEYEADQNVYTAWWYVDHHPVFWKFSLPVHADYPVNHVSHLMHGDAWQRGWPEIIPHKVNPGTGRVEDDKTLNTRIEWWYEFGNVDLYPNEHGIHDTYHDYQLDGGADSYDGAVLEIAWKIHEHYGNDRMLVDSGDEYWKNRVVPESSSGIGKILGSIREENDD